MHPLFWDLLNVFSLGFMLILFFYQKETYSIFWALVFVMSIIGKDAAIIRENHEKENKRTRKPEKDC